MEQRTVELKHPAIDTDALGYFRFGRIAGRVLVTNDAGDWAFLGEDEFADLLAGRIAEGHDRFEEFGEKGLIRDGLDLDAFAARAADRNRHVRRGPHVHVVTLTSRPAPGADGGADSGRDMSKETAEAIVDFALAGLSTDMTFEMQATGGEPLVNFETLRHFVETAQRRNTQTTGKTVSYVVLTNLTAMTEEVAEWLLDNDVRISVTFDGPADVHDANREILGGSSHADTVRWIEYFNRRYVELERDPGEWHVETRVAVTRKVLEAPDRVVEEYANRGLRAIHVNPLRPSRVSPETWSEIGYTDDQYIDFHVALLDSILGRNRQGLELAEGTAAIIATKILRKEDPGIVDIQSPYGAGTGQIAYDVDGRLYPCDEARSMNAEDAATFALGSVGEIPISEITRHPTVRAIAAASLLDSQPMCADCWNKPYCGFSPVRNFIEQGDLFGQRPNCSECKLHMELSTKLFEQLAETDGEEILARWVGQRPRLGNGGRAVKDAP